MSTHCRLFKHIFLLVWRAHLTRRAKNINFQPLHFNKKFNNVNSIFSNLTITIHYLLFKQLYFLSPFSFLSLYYVYLGFIFFSFNNIWLLIIFLKKLFLWNLLLFCYLHFKFYLKIIKLIWKKLVMRLFGFVELCFAIFEKVIDFPYFLSFFWLPNKG